MNLRRVNPIHLSLALLLLVAGAVLILFWDTVKVPMIDTCEMVLGEEFCGGATIRKLAATFLWAMGILPIILFLELFFRAKPDQPIISTGLIQDFVWFVALIFFVTFLLTEYNGVLSAFYENNLSFMRVELIASLPVSVQVVVVVLISDFIGWFDHWVRHKVPFLWEFHKVHHAPRELNFFTNTRLHPMDYIAIATIGLPFLMLDLEVAAPTFAGWLIFKEVHLFFIHGNIRTNLGPLRYILTTPQSHRIHHSIEHRHMDKNFAVHFVIWDFLFGTQWRQWDEYPDTGVEDDSFPIERSARPMDLLTTLGKQFVYPFTRLAPSKADPPNTF